MKEQRSTNQAACVSSAEAKAAGGEELATGASSGRASPETPAGFPGSPHWPRSRWRAGGCGRRRPGNVTCRPARHVTPSRPPAASSLPHLSRDMGRRVGRGGASFFRRAAAPPDPEAAAVAEAAAAAAAAPGGMGESIPLGAPVPVEQAVLETFFSHLGIFSYDKAKDNVEKEREANKSAGASWLALLAGLAHLAAAEKAYHSMTFLGQKLGTAGPPGRRPAPPRGGIRAAPPVPRVPRPCRSPGRAWLPPQVAGGGRSAPAHGPPRV